MPRFTYNARTGELSGLTTIKIGDPQVSIEEYVTNYISDGNEANVYDSDLVVSTIQKNRISGGFDSDQVVAIINENSSGGSGGLDSDTIMNMADEHGWALDSDDVLAAVLKNLNIANVATTSNITDLDSDILVLQNSVLDHANRLDSDSTQIQSNKTRIYTVVKDNDSDHNKKLIRIESQLDSDRSQFEAVKRFILGQNTSGPSNNLHEYYQTSGGFSSNPFHDSDAILTTVNKGYNPSAATYDSDLVVNTIDLAGGTILKDTFLDSDRVFNMGIEHSWNHDSDAVMASVSKNFVTIISFVNNNLGKVDSEFVLTMVDSDEVLNMFREHNIATKNDLDSEVALLKTSLDSETARIQLLLSNADSDQIAIAELRVDADSDTTVIQSLKTQAELDSAAIVLIRNDLDSDTTAIQAINTRVDSDYARTNTRFGSIEGDITTLEAQNTVNVSRLNALEANEDSDYTQFKLLDGRVVTLENAGTGFDSDQVVAIINENTFGSGMTDSDLQIVADLRNDVDSDSIKIQLMQESIDALEAGTYNDAPLVARLDSDTIAISSLRADVDSDNIIIQSLQTQINALDSDYVLERTPLRLNDDSFATTASNQILDTYDLNEYKTVKYIISAKKGNDWQSSECLVNHDGSTSYITEYAIIDSGAGDLYIPDTDISGGAVRLLITPQVTNIDVSIIRTQIQ